MQEATEKNQQGEFFTKDVLEYILGNYEMSTDKATTHMFSSSDLFDSVHDYDEEKSSEYSLFGIGKEFSHISEIADESPKRTMTQQYETGQGFEPVVSQFKVQKQVSIALPIHQKEHLLSICTHKNETVNSILNSFHPGVVFADNSLLEVKQQLEGS